MERDCPFGFGISDESHGGDPLARTSFQFTKRQKELERKKKMEEKRQRKLEKKSQTTETLPDELQPPTTEENPTPTS
jgi:hypothetical protein